MSDIIQLLPDHVANQIAAGEVVQRPSSIVKELMENSIDAKAEKVEVIIRDAGRSLIQVVDDGVGMSETDARMAFERHATSKIKSTEDIFSIGTKGFRGEALASIAAVAQVELKTKQHDAVSGTSIQIEGGKLIAQEPIQTAEGANFSVKNLFFNVPARRKFLKNNNVEFRHILDEFQRVALAHEYLEFNLYHNDDPIFRLRKAGLIQRIVDVFGRKIQPLLVPIKEDLGWIKLEGYVAKPEGAKKARGEQMFFVNRRFFKSAYLNKAVTEAFEGLLMPGYIPTYFLYLELDPEKIDVNIHPQKTEVKFEDESLIYALIRSTIKRSLGIYNVAPSLDFDRSPDIDLLFSSKQNTLSPSSQNKVTPSSQKTVASSLNNLKPSAITVARDFNPFLEEKPSEIEIQNFTEMYEVELPSEPSKINLFDDDEFDQDLLRLPNGYWLYNQGDCTLMMDLGRMHRLVYSEQQRKAKKRNASQKLLFSLEYHMNEMEKAKYLSVAEFLPKQGFEMAVAYENVLRVDAIPEGLKESQALKFLENLFDQLDFKTEEEFIALYENQWNKLHSKSRFDFISKEDAEQLIKDFSALGFPEYLPDGKRCYIELPLDELKNKF